MLFRFVASYPAPRNMSMGRGGVRLSPSLEGISFRPLMARDIDAVEALHKQCLPIRFVSPVVAPIRPSHCFYIVQLFTQVL